MEMSPQLLKQSQWDLSNVFPGLDSEALMAAMDRLPHSIEELADYLDEWHISGVAVAADDSLYVTAAVAGYLEKANAVKKDYRTLSAYLYSFTTTDSYNAEAKKLLSRLQIQGARLNQLEVRFQVWTGQFAAKPELVEELTGSGGIVGQHAFYIKETIEQSAFLMSEREENLASELSLSGSTSWQKLQMAVTSQLKGRIDLGNGVQELPITVIQTYRNHDDGALRRQAYEAELAAWESVEEPLAACLNGVKGEVNTLNRRRGRLDALESSLELARIDRGTLEAMHSSMRESFPSWRRYFRAKAHLLGSDKLPWWDLFAPVGRREKKFSYEEAQQFILTHFSPFSDRLASLTSRAFAGGWVDSEPRDGKVGGAFCMSIPAVEESRILCNFDGSLDQVATLAHELGHAYHNYCLEGKTQLQRRVPMTLAETASIFNQTIITDALLDNSEDDVEKLIILESFLMDAGQVIVDIYSRYLFENEVFRKRETAELSANEFCELMVVCQKETYGDGLDGRYLNPYMWAWKPHYYRAALSFYNYPYAFGLLFGLGLYQIYRGSEGHFQQEYDRLLRDSGEYPASELAARFGIDLSSPQFWGSSLALIQGRIQEYERLVGASH